MPEVVEPGFAGFLEAAANHSHDPYVFAALALLAGLRTSEAVNASWSWIDFERGAVTVPSASRAFSTKNRRPRTIPLSARLRAILEPLHEAKGYLIASENTDAGKWQIRFEPKRSFKTVAKAAGVE